MKNKNDASNLEARQEGPINEQRGQFIEALGGEAGCRAISAAFYGRVANEPELRPLFPGKSFRCATEEFSAFLIQFLGGDEEQTQYRWWLSLRESHARFQISERQRTAWLSLMEETLDSLVTDPETVQAMRQFFHIASMYIVGKDGEELEHHELKHRWSRQQALDQVIKDIANGRDAEAVAGAGQCASSPVVLGGILARMMQTGREPLVEFVLESIRTDRRLVDIRWNGRTLLHHASSAAALPVVRQLLHLGVDPNALDSGGHTALYRAAGVRDPNLGPAVVRLLVQAGATIDHCGGVNRSTALHEAARHGNLHTARALLDAGASVMAKDKNGLTPLDRAVKCRRPEVAAFLIS